MRIDKYLAENGFPSRTKAARAIAEGRVRLNGKIAVPSDSVGEGDVVEVEKSEVSFVSEGGFKLYKALTEFGEDVGGCVFADIGASTGGFTDCLLQSGAARVYAVDVGESQLDKSSSWWITGMPAILVRMTFPIFWTARLRTLALFLFRSFCLPLPA